MPASPEPLHNRLARRIRQQGPLSVAKYMELALAAYYGERDPFGAMGDFITAPEVSQMFGEMVGLWLLDLWQQMGRPAQVRLVELGPGRGTLAADMLRTAARWPDFRHALSPHLVETSPFLRERQAQALAGQGAQWHDSLAGVPPGFSFIIANEFFDALPVHQLEKTAAGWRERRVDYDPARDAFHFITAPLAGELAALMPPDFMAAPEGSVFEISPVSLSLAQEISARVTAHGGAALLIDYGHDAPGFGDTLQAVTKHRYASPLERPGEQDLTAHVDFGTFRAAAEETVAVAGPVPQGQFLNALGIAARAEQLAKNAGDRQRREIAAALHRLTAAREMGRLFKVMALLPKAAKIRPAGFA